MATQPIDIVNNPANPANPTSEQLLDLPRGGTITLYGEKKGASLHLRVTSLRREADSPGLFTLEGVVRLADDTTESRVESSFYNASTGRGTLNVETGFADRYQAQTDALSDQDLVPDKR